MPTPDLDYLHPQLRPLAVAVADLTPDPKNARKRDERALRELKASIQSAGFRSVIIAQKDASGALIIRAGNGRHQAMTELGYDYIPALVFEEDDVDAVAFAIADNRTAELAEWDFDILAEHLTAFDDAGTLDGLGFSSDEVSTLLANNEWEDYDLETATETVEADAGEARHEREGVKLTINVTDVTARVAILKRIKQVLSEEFEGKASL